MTSDPYQDRRRLTFEQAEGVDPLPTQLKTKELSEKLRSRIWVIIFESMKSEYVYNDYANTSFSSKWKNILYAYSVLHKNRFADEFENDAKKLTDWIKSIVKNASYTHVFGFIQFVLRNPNCPHDFSKGIDWALKEGNAAYRILDNKTIVPIGSDAELSSIQHALIDLAKVEFNGARSHLHSAAAHLTAGEYTASVRESIHAVESVARTLTSSGSLNDSLAVLEQKANMHKALKKGFQSIYGYTSDEKGIRHPLLDDPKSKVDEADALFMIGACASFVSYMINKARLAGIIPNEG